MQRKFLVLGILLAFLTAGLVFGQEQQQEQQQGQPIVFQLFGINWRPVVAQIQASYDDIGVKIVLVWAKDISNIAGMVEILVIIDNQDSTKMRVLSGRVRIGSADEQGFYLKEDDTLCLLKKMSEGEELAWRGYDDANGDSVVEFGVFKTGTDERIDGGRIINIKKFVEEHFKAPGK